MRRRTLILSDVHLATLVRPSADGARDDAWLFYRRPEHAVDAPLARTIDENVLRSRAAGASLEVVLNGDFFDLDAPPAHGRPTPDSYAAARTEDGAAETMRRVLVDHPEIVMALRRLLTAGGRLVVVPGNHDAQLAFPAVRGALADALGRPSPVSLVFRSWFHRTPDGVHIEHGHAYDPLCTMERLFAFRADPAEPARLEDTIGSVGTHYGQALFGETNPYAADPLEMSGREIFRALRRCIARDSFASCAPVLGILACARELLLVQAAGEADRGFLDHVARETGATPAMVDRHRGLFARKADVADLAAAATARDTDYGRDVEGRLSSAMLAIADLYGARAVVTGHTHIPFLRRDAPTGVLFANSGAWAPPVGLARPRPLGTYVVLDSDPFGRLDGRIEQVWP